MPPASANDEASAHLLRKLSCGCRASSSASSSMGFSLLRARGQHTRCASPTRAEFEPKLSGPAARL
eukprot:5766617-Prymnesium_polylepis.1